MDLRTRDGHSLHFDVVGAGPTLLCHPGGPGFGASQLGTLGGLDAELELVRIDPRGTGGSDAPVTSSYALADYVADLDALREALGHEQVVLFGHSHGGFVVARYAATYPHRVRGVVLDGTPMRFSDVSFPDSGVAGYFHKWTHKARAYVDAELSRPYEPAGDWFLEREAATIDLRADLLKIEAPTLVVVGADDFASGPVVGEAMVKLLHRGELEIIPRAGHFAWLEQPKFYVAAVSEFVRGLP